MGDDESFKDHIKSIKDYEKVFNLNKFDKKLIRGFMRGSGLIFMLWLISKKGKHGYEIMTQIHESSPFGKKVKMPSPSIIYPKLHQLERKGLIKGTWEHHGKRKVKYYEITEEGNETLSRIKIIFKSRETNLYEEFIQDMLSLK
ncbi:MAG: PadR family transcriptional regulator [Methanomicrobiales archaeon]